MNGYDLACLIAAFTIVILGLFLVVIERTNERDDARRDRDSLTEALDTTEAAYHELRQAHSGGRIVQPLVRGHLRSVPTQREASDYDWTPPQNADDALWSALYGPGGEHRG